MALPPSGWYPRRGEVYWLQLDKDRPALVISSDVLNRHAFDICVVPITTVYHKRFSLRIGIKPGDGGLPRDSWAKCDQVTTLEKRMLRYPPLGKLTDSTLRRIEAGIRIALDLA